jgi:hypothetical protein
MGSADRRGDQFYDFFNLAEKWRFWLQIQPFVHKEIRIRNIKKISSWWKAPKWLIITLTRKVTFRVARWYSFKPKIQSWVNFGGSCNGRCWYILWTVWSILQPFGLIYGHFVYFVVTWYIFSALVCCTD